MGGMTPHPTASEETLHEPRLWRDQGWTARVVKNNDDEGWAVEMVKAGKPKPSAKTVRKPTGGKWPRHPANRFREGSSYGTCFDVLAAHPDGLPRKRLVELLAKATGKPPKLAAFDVQVVCSARKNDQGLNPFEGPRNRSCKHGFYVERVNGHVKLVLPATTAKETP